MSVTATAAERSTRRIDAIRILGDLVRFNTVSDRSNLDLIHYVESCLHALGAQTWRLPSADGLKANLVARLGPDVEGGLMLSGHTDVVPVDGQAWSTQPFEMTRVDGRLFGRGTADMKGFLACVLACLPEITKRQLRKPIYLALSYDEELGCLGVHDIISDLNRREIRPDLCIVGEPTMMDVGLAHKGNRTFRLTFTGQAAHSSLAPTAVNAVAYAAELVTSITVAQAEIARQGPVMEGFDIEYTTVHVGVMTGGRQVNIVPDRCVIDMEFRFLPGEDPDVLAERLIMAEVRRLDKNMAARMPGCGVTIEPVYAYPAFDMSAEHPSVLTVKRCAGRNGDVKLSYGTEAGCFRAAMEMPVVVCGPGDIRQAHQPDEYIAIDQLDACGDFLIDLVKAVC